MINMKRIGNLLLIPMSVFLLGVSGDGTCQIKKDQTNLSHQNQDGASSEQSIQEWKRLSSQFIKTYQTGDYPAAEGFAKQALALAGKELDHKYIYTSMANLSRLYQDQGHYDKAEPLYIEALALRKKVLGKQHPSTLASMNGLAKLYQTQGQYDKAESLYIEVLAVSKKVLGVQHPDTLASMNGLAILYQALAQYKKAEPLYVEVLAISKKVLGEQHPDTLISMSNLAVLYQFQGHYDKAVSLSVKSLALLKKVLGKQHPETLASMGFLAELYRSQGDYHKAEPLFVESLALSKLGMQNPYRLATMGNLAKLYKNQGQYDKAESLFIEVLALNKKKLGKQHPDTLSITSSLASLYKAQGHYEKAESLYIEVLTVIKKVLGKQHPDMLSNMNNLASLYKAQGHYEKAEPIHIETLALTKKILGKQHPDTLNCMNNLAGLYEAQGHYEKAEPLYIEVLALSKKVLGKQHPITLTFMNNLAGLYKAQGQYEKAEPIFVETLASIKKVLGKQHPKMLAIMNNLAILYQAQGHYEKAELLFIEVLGLRKKGLGKHHPDTLSSINNLAVLYQAQGHYKKAKPLYIETLALNKKVLGKLHPNTLKGMYNLAIMYHHTEQWGQAKVLHNEYLVNSNHRLQQVLWGAGKKTRLSYLQQQKKFQDNYLSLYNHLITPDTEKQNQLAQQAWKISVSRKGLLLRIASEASALSKLHQANDPQLAKLSQQIRQTRSEIAALTFSAQPNPTKQATLDDQLNTLQRQLGSKVSQFRDKTQTIQPENILSALSQQQAVVDFLIYKEVDLKTGGYKTEQLIAFVASQEQGVKFINLGELAPITQLIQNYRGEIEYKPNNPTWFASKKRKKSLTKTSQALYKKLWQPLTNALAKKKQIYLIPDGALHLLPFKALQNEQGEYLAQQVELTRIGSVRDIVFQQQTIKTNPSTIMANPIYSAQVDNTETPNQTVSRKLRNLNFTPLPGTQAESDSIQKIMQQLQQLVNVYTEKQASESTIKKEKSPRILHIATHGFFLEKLAIPEENELTRGIQFNDRGKMAVAFVQNPLARSGLAFSYANQGIKGQKQADGSDGILTALEVIDLNLAGTELVTLSACETGVGEISVGEGVYSLNRAFQEAGAKAVLSTLWSISDKGTKLFMQKFYQRFLNQQSAQQALRETQEEFKNSEQWNDPFFWAAFVVTGL